MNPDSSSGPRPIFKTVVVLIALLAALAVAMFAIVISLRIRAARRPSQALILTDGSRVELLGITFGTAQFTNYNEPWRRVVRKLLPPGARKWIPTPLVIGGSSSGSNSVEISFQWVSASIPGSFKYVTEDDAGFRYPPEFATAISGTSSNWLVGVVISAFPRRQKDFLLRVLDSQGIVVGTLHLRNPANDPFPEWKPLPLPQTITNGPVVLTLRSLRTIGPVAQPYTKASWQINSTNSSWTRATEYPPEFLDATGNQGGFLSPREPAWKLHAVIARTNLDDFSPDEQLVLSNLAIPAANTFASLDRGGECAGIRVSVQVLSGAGTIIISNRTSRSMLPAGSPRTGYSVGSAGGSWESWSEVTPFLLVAATNMETTEELVCRLRDDRGQELKTRPYFQIYTNGTRRYQFKFAPSDDAKSLNVQLIVNRPLTFDFMINPADIQSARP